MSMSFDMLLPGQKALVYVEDEITVSYLKAILGDKIKLIRFQVVGGRKSVLGMLEDDFRAGVKCTFGIVDRDYVATGKAGWNLAYGRGYSLPGHEIENYLLDFDALATYRPDGNPPPKNAAYWRTMALATAKQYFYSVVYNQLIAEIRGELLKDYPEQIKLTSVPCGQNAVSYPGLALKSDAEVLIKIQNEKWVKNAPAGFLSANLAAGALQQRIRRIEARYQADLQSSSDDWVKTFPGKEMFRSILHALVKDDSFQLEIARCVGEYQRKATPATIPPDICAFTDALLK